MQNQLALRSGTDKSNNIPHFDGIRGLAILLVAVGHFFYEFYISKLGWIGLNLFFILSGYLITRSLFQYKLYSAQSYFRNFYARRILRIFPLYYAVLIFFFLLLPLISHNLHLYYSGLDSIQGSYWFYTSNWNMIRNGMPDQPVFFHFWSLAVEEQFYLVWPVLFLICRNTRTRYILISVLLCLSITTRIITENPLHAYLSSLTAAEPLLFGCLLSVFHAEGVLEKINKKLNMAAILSALFLCFVFLRNPDLHITNELLMKYGYSAINIILGSIVCSVLIGHLWGLKARRFFSMQWLRWIGKYSYAIYVFHWIILQTIVYKAEAVLTTNHFPGVLTYLLPRVMGIVLTLLLSFWSYHYFEKHFLALKKHFTDDKRWNWSISWNYISQKITKPVKYCLAFLFKVSKYPFRVYKTPNSRYH